MYKFFYGSPLVKRTPSFVNPIEIRQWNEFPIFTKPGYKGLKLPLDLRRRLTYAWLDNRKELMKPETVNPQYISKGGSDNPTFFMPLSSIDPKLVQDLEKFVESELKKWTNVQKLKHTATYGIREYTDGAILSNHVDRFDTHILSAIIHVGSILPREDWALLVQNRDTSPTEVIFNRDVDVVLYESATLIHGRPKPFQGDVYANMFVHFAPVNWMEDVVKKLPTTWPVL